MTLTRAGARASAALFAVAVCAVVLSCARPGSPTGGVPDRRPPAVIAADPAPLARVTDPSAPVRFQFSERISERLARGTLAEAVLVSPATGAVQVDQGRDWIEVRLEGGWRMGLVYRVTLLPVINDLFGNAAGDPFELVFSTGGELIEWAIAGQALDRVTGRPLPELSVELGPPGPVADTLRYLARTDADGLFFLRFVPAGRYTVTAYQDRNRNGVRDRTEPWGDRGAFLGGERVDTLLTDIAVREPDTTAAVLTRAEAVDSVTIRLVFDDFLDPESTDAVAVGMLPPEGDTAPGVTAILHPAVFEARRDSARADAAAAAPGSRVPGVGETMAVPGQERGGLPRGVPLPRAELIVVVDAPLPVGDTLRVSATSVVNINGIPGGRGEVRLVRPRPPAPPAAAPADSAAVRPDTLEIARRR